MKVFLLRFWTVSEVSLANVHFESELDAVRLPGDALVIRKSLHVILSVCMQSICYSRKAFSVK